MPEKHCTSIDCPERRSLCCNAKSELYNADEGTNFFMCSKCKHEYVGGECTAGDIPPNAQRTGDEGRVKSKFFEELEFYLDEYFPKGECKERGAALVVFAWANQIHDKIHKSDREAFIEREKKAFWLGYGAGVNKQIAEEHLSPKEANELFESVNF